MPKQLKTSAELRAAAAERRMVDEYGDLVKRIAPFKADIARVTALASAIRALHAESDPSSQFTVEGDFYVATLGPKGSQTRIEDMQDVYDALGHARFVAFCSMTLGALEKAGANMAALTTQEQTGSRPLTVTEIAE